MSTPVRTAHSYCVVVGLAVATLLGRRVPPLSSRLNNSLRSVSTLHYSSSDPTMHLLPTLRNQAYLSMQRQRS